MVPLFLKAEMEEFMNQFGVFVIKVHLLVTSALMKKKCLKIYHTDQSAFG